MNQFPVMCSMQTLQKQMFVKGNQDFSGIPVVKTLNFLVRELRSYIPRIMAKGVEIREYIASFMEFQNR